MTDPARLLDRTIDWLTEHRGTLGFWLGIAVVSLAWAVAGQEPARPIYRIEFPCPTGERVQSVTSDDEVVMLCLLVITGKITPVQFRLVMIAKFPDRKGDIEKFVAACLGGRDQT